MLISTLIIIKLRVLEMKQRRFGPEDLRQFEKYDCAIT